MDVPLDLFLCTSNDAAGTYQLKRLDEAMQLRKELKALVDRLIDLHAEAMAAQWVRENRSTFVGALAGEGGPQEVLPFPQFPKVS